MELRIKCLIFSGIDDDFATIWEILSIVSQKVLFDNETEFLVAVSKALMELVGENYLNVYLGTHFKGEESIVYNVELNADFLVSHKDDWKNHADDTFVEEYKLYITELGRNYNINNCSPEFFK